MTFANGNCDWLRGSSLLSAEWVRKRSANTFFVERSELTFLPDGLLNLRLRSLTSWTKQAIIVVRVFDVSLCEEGGIVGRQLALLEMVEDWKILTIPSVNCEAACVGYVNEQVIKTAKHIRVLGVSAEEKALLPDGEQE